MKTKIHLNRVVELDPRMLEDLGIKLGDKVDLYLRDTESIFLVKYRTRRQEDKKTRRQEDKKTRRQEDKNAIAAKHPFGMAGLMSIWICEIKAPLNNSPGSAIIPPAIIPEVFHVTAQLLRCRRANPKTY